nr:hypothetical protein GCM10017745_42220 [Saccharothrix mutabilis subsp. capreolus]
MTTAHRTCPICDSVCGLKIELTAAGRVTRVTGDERDPFTGGYICPKGAGLGQLDEDPDRLRHPLIREGDGFREASWEEAFEAVERGLGEVVEKHGRDAVAVFFGNPTYHTMAGFLYRVPLIQALASKNVYSSGTIDHMPKHVACGHLYGDPFAIAVPDIDRTDYLLVIGANPMESHGSLFCAPNMPARLRALRKRGGKLVVVDPRRTRTADAADEHFFVRPGTDPFLLLGIVHTLFAEGLTAVTHEGPGWTSCASWWRSSPRRSPNGCAACPPTTSCGWPASWPPRRPPRCTRAWAGRWWSSARSPSGWWTW